MRDNSGGGDASTNTRDPTLKDHEKKKGTSGEAITGEKKVDAQPDRKSTERR